MRVKLEASTRSAAGSCAEAGRAWRAGAKMDWTVLLITTLAAPERTALASNGIR
jgi:hypothetical protein